MYPFSPSFSLLFLSPLSLLSLSSFFLLIPFSFSPTLLSLFPSSLSLYIYILSLYIPSALFSLSGFHRWLRIKKNKHLFSYKNSSCLNHKYFLFRLELYINNMADHHLITDLVPALARCHINQQLGDVRIDLIYINVLLFKL